MATQPEPVVLINAFEVPADADEDFVEGWEQARDYLRGQPGFVSTRLHRSIAPTAEFRFVNVAQWESPAAFQAAIGSQDFPGARLMAYSSHRSLYEVVRS